MFALYHLYYFSNTFIFPHLYYLPVYYGLVYVNDNSYGGFISHSSKYPIDFPFSSNYYKLYVSLNFMSMPLSFKTRLPMIHS